MIDKRTVGVQRSMSCLNAPQPIVIPMLVAYHDSA